MSDIKPWQIGLIIVAVIVLAFSGWRMMRSGVVAGPDGQMTVDVLTGQLYDVRKGKAKGIMYPAKNPETGDRTLFPLIRESESDSWILNTRLGNAVTDEMRENSDALGAGLQIDILDTKPIVVVIKK